MRIVGIEGTAWAASAALFDSETGEVFIESDPYEPDSGGIHPREAAEHMGEAIPDVVATVLDRAAETSEGDGAGIDVAEGTSAGRQAAPVDAVAFSRGPGLGPCLRIVGTAARALAQTLDVPLIGVNHMVAHLEIGRYESGFDSPVCLNASGANAHLLGYHNGRYRVLGETMDTGVGNAIDKFTRHVGWTHPGGPKVEEAARSGDYHDLPYVVKGMDFSFSGIMSAAKQAHDDGVPVEDVCRGLQETIFAMLTEVAERALSLTGTDELVLGGGVGQNARLREMLAEMCEQRGAAFYAPEPRFLRDNAGMIAVLGARMLDAGDTLSIPDSAVDPNFRPDQVPVTWRDDEESVARDPAAAAGPVAAATGPSEVRGAEATVTFEGDSVVKRRVPKTYRHPRLDDRLRTERTRAEARLTSLARRAGVPTPVVRDVDPTAGTIVFQYVGESDLAAALTAERCRTVGEHLAAIHGAGFVHGDPTTRNVRVGGDRVYLLDFGLGYHTDHVEDRAMDLHVFEQSVEGTADEPDPLCRAFEAGYAAVARDGAGGEATAADDVDGRSPPADRTQSGDDEDALTRLRQVEGRGRYQ